GIYLLLFLVTLSKKAARADDAQAQRQRDREALKLRSALARNDPVKPYTIWLRPFTSTGRLHIVLVDKIYFSRLPHPDGTGSGPSNVRVVELGDLELVLADKLRRVAPLVGLGRSGEQPGAGRIESEEESWHSDFHLLARRARAIYVVPAPNEGTQWEIAEI